MRRLVILALGVWLAGCSQDANDSGASGAQSLGETGAVSETAAPDPKAPSSLATKDMEFMKDAARGGRAEVQIGQMGLANSESQAVKDFSQRLVDDHTKANQELEKLAIKKKVNLPDSVGMEHQKAIQHLSSLKGREFDAAFKEHTVSDHEKDIKEFKTAGKSADPELRSFAEKVLPALQQHLEMARALP
jgi:putative membrane protein